MTALTLAVLASLAGADGLRCADLGKSPSAAERGTCAALAAAPRAPDHAWTRQAVGVWRRVYGPMSALTGRDSALAVLAQDAQLNGRALPPAAVVCPGAPPVVYVPWTLLERVYAEGAEYPEDFLAFVLGHELGHRANDLTDDGCELEAFQRPGKGRSDEALADNRGAFFAAVAGYSPKALAKADTVAAFLEGEFKVRGQALDSRRAALQSALAHFDAYEHLYQTALAFAFGASRDTALRLLGWADELIASGGVPLPELTLVRGLVALMAAAPDAPVWAGLDTRVASLRCQPVFPSHSALWDGPRPGRRAAGRGDALLAEARRHLERAQELGASDAVVQSGLGCVALYRGDGVEARRRFARARAVLGARPAPREALERNDALSLFVDALRAAPLPGLVDVAGRKAWVTRFRTAQPALAKRPELAVVLDALPKPSVRLDGGATPPTCGALAAAPLVLATTSVSANQCPHGMTARHVLPDGEPLVVACSDAQGTEWATLVSLPGTTEPPMAPERLIVHERRRPTGSAASLAAWGCACALTERGAGDGGGRAYLARCAAPSDSTVPVSGVLFSGVLFSGGDGAIERVLRFESPD